MLQSLHQEGHINYESLSSFEAECSYVGRYSKCWIWGTCAYRLCGA